MCIRDSFLYDAFAEWDEQQDEIPEGSRNQTMSRYAGRLVVRLGDTEEAYKMFSKKAALCNPPLPEDELDKIWQSALRFGRRVSEQEGYVPPDEYGQSFMLRPPDYSDIGQAKMLVREYGEELVYTSATDYLRYDGVRWVESKQRAVGAMEEFLDKQLSDAMKELEQACLLYTSRCV